MASIDCSPRVWLVFFNDDSCEGRCEPIPPATEPYLSLKEHQTLINKAIADTWEDAAIEIDCGSQSETSEEFLLLFRKKAKETRQILNIKKDCI